MNEATIHPIRPPSPKKSQICEMTITFHLQEEVTPEIFLKRVAQACGDAYAIRPGEGVSVPGYRIDVAAFQQNAEVRRLARSFQATAKRAIKLTADKVGDIRVMLADGVDVKKIATHYGVDDGTIRKIRDRKTWRNV